MGCIRLRVSTSLAFFSPVRMENAELGNGHLFPLFDFAWIKILYFLIVFLPFKAQRGETGDPRCLLCQRWSLPRDFHVFEMLKFHPLDQNDSEEVYKLLSILLMSIWTITPNTLSNIHNLLRLSVYSIKYFVRIHVDCFPLTSNCKILNAREDALGIIILFLEMWLGRGVER